MIKVHIAVKDDDAETYITDLCRKSNSNALAVNEKLGYKTHAITRALLSSLFRELGMLSASSDCSSSSYYYNACVRIGLLREILTEAGINLEAIVTPESLLKHHNKEDQ